MVELKIFLIMRRLVKLRKNFRLGIEKRGRIIIVDT